MAFESQKEALKPRARALKSQIIKPTLQRLVGGKTNGALKSLKPERADCLEQMEAIGGSRSSNRPKH